MKDYTVSVCIVTYNSKNIIERTINHISKADMLIVGGTSLAVYPAAGLIDYFRGKYLVVVNMSATSKDVNADIYIKDKIGEVFAKL